MSQLIDRTDEKQEETSMRTSLLDSSGFNPLDYPISTQLPKRLGTPTAWTGHIPFAMGLVEMVRPRLIVELGTHWGASYCAFCHAVKELQLDTRCFAVDTWAGDPYAGYYDSSVLDYLKAHHDAEYSRFSELVQSTFDEAVSRFQDGTIDILHIDGFHTYEGAKNDFDTWLPKMSERGVILIHDTEIRSSESYGVWQLWDEVKQQYPHFELHDWFGLGVLAVGKSIPSGLRKLVSASKADAARFREYYTHLGEKLCRDELFLVSLQLINSNKLLHAKSDEAALAQGERAQALAECAQAHAERAVAQANCDRAQAELALAQAEIARAHAEIARAHAECAGLSGELDTLRRHYVQIRYRVIDRLAERIGRFPPLYRALRSLARVSFGASHA